MGISEEKGVTGMLQTSMDKVDERGFDLRIWEKNWWIIGRKFPSVPTMSLSTGDLGCEKETWSLWQEVLASGNWRERGHVTSTHHQLYQILLVQLAGSRVISHFPKVPREISSSVGPSSQRTGDRFEGWSGLLGSDKEEKLKTPNTSTHITSDEINLLHWIQHTAGNKTTSKMEGAHLFWFMPLKEVLLFLLVGQQRKLMKSV